VRDAFVAFSVSLTAAPATIASEESETTPEMLVELAACAWSEAGHSAKKQSRAANIATNCVLAEKYTNAELQRGRTRIRPLSHHEIFLTPAKPLKSVNGI
jgi:hypothetical protein